MVGGLVAQPSQCVQRSSLRCGVWSNTEHIIHRGLRPFPGTVGGGRGGGDGGGPGRAAAAGAPGLQLL